MLGLTAQASLYRNGDPSASPSDFHQYVDERYPAFAALNSFGCRGRLQASP